MEQTSLNEKRIKREKPNKKWSEKEIQSILDFLQEAPEVEAPTAQIFYKKLSESTKIDATWDLIRWKVRHLKGSYKKASDWRMSTGAGLVESDAGTSSVEGKVLQMCSHFNQLKHIFGKKATSELPFKVVDSGSTSIMNESAATQILEITFCDVGEEIASPIDIANIENLPPGNISEVIVPEKAKYFAEKTKKHVPKSSAANLAAFQVERRQMFKMKMEWEKEKHEKDNALNERRLQAEIERGKAEIIFKNRELDLKILELEKDERLKNFKVKRRNACKVSKLKRNISIPLTSNFSVLYLSLFIYLNLFISALYLSLCFKISNYC